MGKRNTVATVSPKSLIYNFTETSFDIACTFLEKEHIDFIVYYSECFDSIVVGDIEYLFGTDDGDFVKWRIAAPKN